jgi:glycosyltransferase involved in cell wall biosynthesis
VRLFFVADGHSPIALNWIRYFVESGHEVHLATTYPASPDLALASLTEVPVAFSGAARSQDPEDRLGPRGAASQARRAGFAPWHGARTLPLRILLRHWLGPRTVPAAARRLRLAIQASRPDLVHALRIPFEGMLAAQADPAAPLLLSVWGNDFTFHAPASPPMTVLTRRALRRAQALHADCQRDLRLARQWGFPKDRPQIVLPGNGGIRPEVFFPRGDRPDPADRQLGERLRSIPDGAPVVIYPRGFRAYVRLDTFFRMIPLVLRSHPQVRFLCPAMAGDALAEGWLRRLGIEQAVHLLPRLSPQEMAAAFRRSTAAVSPSMHDGTPNTLLEAMACGCVPVAGDIESIREWIEDGVNGLLIDPSSPEDLARGVERCLIDADFRARAVAANLEQIARRATHARVMAEAEGFYRSLLQTVTS